MGEHYRHADCLADAETLQCSINRRRARRLRPEQDLELLHRLGELIAIRCGHTTRGASSGGSTRTMRPSTFRSADLFTEIRKVSVTRSPTASSWLPEIKMPPALASRHTAHTSRESASTVTGNQKV